MQITVTLNHTDIVAPEMLAFLQSLTNGNGEVSLKATSPKVETAKKEASSKSIAPEKEEVIKEEKNVEISNVTLEQVRAAVQAKAQAGKRTEIKELLTDFGTENVTSLSKEKYADFLLKINAL